MILLTGGSGRLGTELRKHLNCIAPSHAEFDILDPKWPEGVSMVVHCAAYTDVQKAETERARCFALNVSGTRNMAVVPLVYVSTEYVFSGMMAPYAEDDEPSPQNYYALTKVLGEQEARKAPRSLVVRCLFKERPFRHPMACVDQWTTGDYVDVIARMVAQCALWFRSGHFKKKHDTIHVGTRRKTTFDLAMQTRDVQPIYRADVPVRLPKDTSLNTDRYYDMCKALEHGY